MIQTAHARHVAGDPAPPAGEYDADVIILALDRPEDTIAAIASALDQTGVRQHVIVVDQGSDPGNLAKLSAAAGQRTGVTLVALDRNIGVPGGRNLATSLGHGRVVVGLDNDAVFGTPDTLARMVEALESLPGLAAIGCRIVVHSTGEDDWSSWGYAPVLKPLADASFPSATFVGAGHAIRRAAWDAVGGYDASLFFCWEEYDFSLRAIAAGWRIRYRGDIVIRHKVSPERRVTWSGTRWFHFVRNRIYIERKYGRSWLALTPRIVGYGIKAARNGCWRGTCAAVLEAARMAQNLVPTPLPPAARVYLLRSDRVHRGGWLTRLRQEVLASLPGNATLTSSALPQ